jgi:hypothetical protein
VDAEGFTDVSSVLMAAFDRKVDAIYLVTDGVATRGVGGVDPSQGK